MIARFSYVYSLNLPNLQRVRFQDDSGQHRVEFFLRFHCQPAFDVLDDLHF